MERTSQLNVGGNMDFYNMLERERLDSKKISKTNAVTSIMGHELPAEDVHVGPSDYVAWLTDRKWAHIRLEGKAFGDVPLTVELKLEVWDSPNSAGVVIDAVRLIKLALNNGIAGQLDGPSSYLMKSPHTPAPRRRGARADRGVHRRQRPRQVAGWPGRRGAGGRDQGLEPEPASRGLLCCLVPPEPLSIAQVRPTGGAPRNPVTEFVARVSEELERRGHEVLRIGTGDPVKRLLTATAARTSSTSTSRSRRASPRRRCATPSRSTSPPSTRRRSGCSRPRWRGRWSRSSSAGSTPAR